MISTLLPYEPGGEEEVVYMAIVEPRLFCHSL
jgi:hypothetical protein